MDPRSPALEQMLEAIATARNALARRTAEDRVHAVGYSLGGRMLLHHLVRNRGAGFASVLLIGSHLGLKERKERLERLQMDRQWIRILQNKGPSLFFTQWKNQPLLRRWNDLPEAQRKAAMHRAAEADPEAWIRILEELSPGKLPSLEPDLESLDLPILLLAGERDTKYADYYRNLAPRLPRAEARMIPGAGHAAHLDQPVAVLEVFSRWISSC